MRLKLEEITDPLVRNSKPEIGTTKPADAGNIWTGTGLLSTRKEKLQVSLEPLKVPEELTV